MENRGNQKHNKQKTQKAHIMNLQFCSDSSGFERIIASLALQEECRPAIGASRKELFVVSFSF